MWPMLELHLFKPIYWPYFQPGYHRYNSIPLSQFSNPVGLFNLLAICQLPTSISLPLFLRRFEMAVSQCAYSHFSHLHILHKQTIFFIFTVALVIHYCCDVCGIVIRFTVRNFNQICKSQVLKSDSRSPCKEFPVCCGCRTFITLFSGAIYCTQPWPSYLPAPSCHNPQFSGRRLRNMAAFRVSGLKSTQDIYIYNIYINHISGARGGVVVKALRYNPAGRGFDSRWCHWNFAVT
jgi:hypothetical protein